MADELSSSEPRGGSLRTSVSTTWRHLRWSSPPSVTAVEPAAGLGAEAAGGVVGCGVGRGAGAGATWGAGWGAAGFGAGTGRGAGAGAGCGVGCGAGTGLLAAVCAGACCGATGCWAGAGCSTASGCGAGATFFSPCAGCGVAAGRGGVAGRAGADGRGACGVATGAAAGDAGVAGAVAAGIAPGTMSSATRRSSWATRSARESSVRSLLGRAILVSATSSTRRWSVAVRISFAASPSTTIAREILSTEPNASASSRRFCSSSSLASTTPGFAPTAATTYTSRRWPASSRVNSSRSRPWLTRSPTAENSVGTLRSAMAQATLTNMEPLTSPSRSWADSSDTLPSPNTESFSSVLSASRMPPRAWRTTSSSAALSYSKPSWRQTSSRWASMSGAPMARKSKRWTRERMVSGIFCGSVVHSTNTTCSGGSSSVLSSALNAAVVSMWTSSMI